MFSLVEGQIALYHSGYMKWQYAGDVAFGYVRMVELQ